MTQREFYNAIVNGTINEEVIAHATESLAKLDATNEKRKNKPTKASVENEPIAERIVTEILGTEAMTASDIAAKVEISVQKCSAIMRGLVADGKVTVSDVKVPKKGTVKAYKLA